MSPIAPPDRRGQPDASNVFRRAACAYCYNLPAGSGTRRPNTHILKWDQRYMTFFGNIVDHGTPPRRYSCARCAVDVQQNAAGRGLTVRAYRFRKDPAR